jgi:hypothetical protein
VVFNVRSGGPVFLQVCDMLCHAVVVILFIMYHGVLCGVECEKRGAHLPAGVCVLLCSLFVFRCVRVVL